MHDFMEDKSVNRVIDNTDFSNEYVENGLLIQEVDVQNLEQGLLRTAALIDEHHDFVVLLKNYETMLATMHKLDYHKLSDLLGIQIGLYEDKQTILTHRKQFRHIHVSYGKDIEKAISTIIDALLTLPDTQKLPSKRHVAVRLLESPEQVLDKLPWCAQILPVVEKEKEKIFNEYNQDVVSLINKARQGFVHGALQETITHAEHDEGHSLRERIDQVLTNPWLGFPVLFLMLYIVFEVSFSLGAYPQAWINQLFDSLCVWLRTLLPDTWWTSMLLDGVVLGVGAVLSFLPTITVLFCFLSLMEDTHYSARVAFLMDKVMHRVGLHGRSFVPMLVGFGCNVPAIMMAKDIENRKDRTLTMLMIPFMSCSARLPVYVFFISIFFTQYKALIMMAMYLIGILLSILFALIMKRTKLFSQPPQDYVSTLPAFRKPTFKNTGLHIWEQVYEYLQKITTVVLGASIVIWTLMYFPTQNLEESYLAQIGRFIEPLVRPLGFDWKMTVCLLTGLPAKEAIVSTLGILFPATTITTTFTPLTAFTFMVFVLLYFPCVATVTTLRREIGIKWALFSIVNSMILAWVISFIIYQIGILVLG